MGIIQKDASQTMLISYTGIILGYINKGLLFLIILSTEQIGLINLIYSIGMLFAQFANFGAIYSTWKFLPFFKNTERKHFGFFPFILSIVLLGIITCSALFWFFQVDIQSLYSEKAKGFNPYFFWVLPIGISYVLFMFFEVYLRAFYKNIFSVFALEIVLRLALTILLLLLWSKVINFHNFVILHSVIYIIPTLLLLYYLLKIKEFNINYSTIAISKKFKKIILQFSAFNYLNTLGTVLVNSLDVIMLAHILGLKETGVFTTVVFLASALQVPYKSLIRISAPIISDYWKKREFSKMKELYQKVSSISLLIGLGTFLPIWMNIDFLFSFLKPEFQEGKWVFLFLMIGKLLDMYFGLNGSIFSTSKKYKFDILFTILLIVTVYSLNLVLIPMWGISGAAISTSIALVFYNIGRVIFVWRIYKMHPFSMNQFKIIGLAILTLFAGYLSKTLATNSFVNVLIQCLIILVLFVFPIIRYDLESESVAFLKRFRNKFNKNQLK